MWPNKAPALESIEDKLAKRSEPQSQLSTSIQPKADVPEESKEAKKEVEDVNAFLGDVEMDEN